MIYREDFNMQEFTPLEAAIQYIKQKKVYLIYADNDITQPLTVNVKVDNNLNLPIIDEPIMNEFLSMTKEFYNSL